MIRLVAVILLALAGPWLAGTGAAAAEEASFDMLEGFEQAASMDKWEFSDGPEFPGASGSFERSREQAHSGDWSGKLAWKFEGGNYVMASMELPPDNGYNQFDFWVRKTSGNSLTFRVTDSEGQTFQKSVTFRFPDWQRVSVTMRGWSAHWGGANDGTFRGSPTTFGIILDNNDVPEGAIYIDDLRASTVEAAPEGSFQTNYLVTDFATGPQWNLTGAGDYASSSFGGQTLTFDFSDATTIGPETDIAIMGRPESIKLRLQSDGSGHELRIRIASHFQFFDRVMGTLDEEGEMTFEVPMGGMQGWRYYGGQNDGMPLYPLRLSAILLDRKEGGATSGEIKLLEVRSVTTVQPDRGVILVPEANVERDTATFRVELRNMLPDKSDGRLVYTLRDWDGRVIARGSRDVSVDQGSAATVEVKSSMDGRPFTECVFSYITGQRTFGPGTASAVARLDDPGSAELRPESPFGMGLYLYRYPGTPEGFQMMDRAAAMGRAAGVKWSREEMLWHRIEPEEGKFDWSYYDRVVDTAHKHGISVYGLIDYWSNWTEPYTQKGIEDYARYCKALVTHYKDRIKHWEVWNEPNIFFWSGPKEMYADLLKAAYTAIKEADPEALVLGCSTSGIDIGFIKMVMEADAPFDILTIHPYRGALNDRGFMKELQDVSELAGGDGPPMPAWITEMGLPTQLYGGLSERNQATFLARCYLSALASGIDTNISWYNFREDGENPFYNEHRFGVVRRRDLAPKPAYRALATICRGLAEQKVAGELDLGEGLLAFRFQGSGEKSLVVWSPGQDRVVSLRSSDPDTISVKNLMGAGAPFVKANGEVILALQANSPLFISGGGELGQGASRLSLSLPEGLHPGSAARLVVSGAGGLAGTSFTLAAPETWGQVTSRKTDDGGMEFSLDIPEDAPAGRNELSLTVESPGGSLIIPVGLEVVSSTIRV